MKAAVKHAVRAISALLLVLTLPAVHAEEMASPSGGRAVAIEVVAVVKSVDLATRQVTFEGPRGGLFTVTPKEDVVKLEDVNVGDNLRVTYLAALEGEVRKPTEEELAEPWVVLQDGGKGMVDGVPMAAGARLVRAVCTIEGMNRLLRTVTVLDSNDMVHVIDDVEPEKMEGVVLGQTIVIVFREALALSLEQVEPGAE